MYVNKQVIFVLVNFIVCPTCLRSGKIHYQCGVYPIVFQCLHNKSRVPMPITLRLSFANTMSEKIFMLDIYFSKWVRWSAVLLISWRCSAKPSHYKNKQSLFEKSVNMRYLITFTATLNETISSLLIF